MWFLLIPVGDGRDIVGAFEQFTTVVSDLLDSHAEIFGESNRVGNMPAIEPVPWGSFLIEGCTRIGALFRVIVSLSAPGVATAGVLTFIAVYNEFFFSFLMSSDRP